MTQLHLSHYLALNDEQITAKSNYKKKANIILKLVHIFTLIRVSERRVQRAHLHFTQPINLEKYYY